MAARVSRSVSRRLIVSRLSYSFLPFARLTATFTRPFLKYMPDGNERHAPLDRLADQLADLVAMQQQLAATQRLVVGVAAMRVRADVDVVEEHLAVLDARETVAQVDASLANRLHLGPEQRHAGLERLEEVEVVKRLAVLGDVRLRELAFGFSVISWCLVRLKAGPCVSVGPSRQSGGQQHRRDHATGIRHALPRDVERRAVIDRRPDDRQASVTFTA